MYPIDLLRGYRNHRARLRDDQGLLPVHRELLQFFEKPRTISLSDIAEKVGYGQRTVEVRIGELVESGRLKKETFPHDWGKPNRYEVLK